MLNILYIFIKPKEVFKKLKKNPDFLYPLIVIIMIQVISGYNTIKLVSQRLPQMQGIPIFFSIIASTIGALVNILILWVVFIVIVSIIGKRGGYKNLLSVIMYGYLPNSAILLIRILFNLPGRGIGLATMLPQNTPTYLFHLLKRVDVFYIWSTVLIIYGIFILYELNRKEVLIVSLLFAIYFFTLPLISSTIQPKTGKGEVSNRRPIFFRFLRPKGEGSKIPRPKP